MYLLKKLVKARTYDDDSFLFRLIYLENLIYKKINKILQVTNNNDIQYERKDIKSNGFQEVASGKELSVISNEDITYAEIIEDDKSWAEENHPNFIDSNTSAISFEEITAKNIIPTFCDNILTISHQNFIGAVTKVAEQFF